MTRAWITGVAFAAVLSAAAHAETLDSWLGNWSNSDSNGVVGIELIYPYCGFPALTRTRGWSTTDIPADVLLLENDQVANEKISRTALERARQNGATIDVETWTGVTHAFEEDLHPEGSRCRYDPERATQAHQRYVRWLTATLNPSANSA